MLLRLLLDTASQPMRQGLALKRRQNDQSQKKKRNQLLRPKAALCSVYVSSASSPHVWTRTWRADGREQILAVIRIHRERSTRSADYPRPGQARPGQGQGPRSKAPQVSQYGYGYTYRRQSYIVMASMAWMDGYWRRLSRLSHLFQQIRYGPRGIDALFRT